MSTSETSRLRHPRLGPRAMSLALSGWVSQSRVSRPSDQDADAKKIPIPLLAGDGFLAKPH